MCVLADRQLPARRVLGLQQPRPRQRLVLSIALRSAPPVLALSRLQAPRGLTLSWLQAEDELEYTPFEEQVSAMGGLIAAGKIRHWGLSNESTFGIMAFCAAADKLGVERPASVQNCFSLLHRCGALSLSADLIMSTSAAPVQL